MTLTVEVKKLCGAGASDERRSCTLIRSLARARTFICRVRVLLFCRVRETERDVCFFRNSGRCVYITQCRQCDKVGRVVPEFSVLFGMCHVIDSDRCVALRGDAGHCGRCHHVEGEGQRELARGRTIGVSVEWRETE